MNNVWLDVVSDIDNNIEDFNNFLIEDFRREAMSKISDNIDGVFKTCMVGFDGQVKYHGYRVLTPAERLAHKLDKNYHKDGSVEVYTSNNKLYAFEFEFENKRFYSVTEIPYLKNNKVLFNGREYHALLTITEKGCRYVCKDSVKIKVMKCPLTFNRSPRECLPVKTISGNTYRHIVLTTKIHQANRKHNRKPPLLGYILSYYTWEQMMNLFNLDLSDIDFVHVPEDLENYEYSKIKNNLYLKFHNKLVHNTLSMRLVTSLMYITRYNKPKDISELKTTLYYQIALGRFTNPSQVNDDVRLLYSNVRKLLVNCDTLLDEYSKRQLALIGVNVKNLFELCVVIFRDIDTWLSTYNPGDLYEKKMNNLNNLLADFTAQIFNKQFKIISNKKKAIKSSTISSFAHVGSKSIGWYLNNNSFEYVQKTGDCSLFQLLKRVYSLDNLEISSKRTGSRKFIPLNVQKAHPSNLSITSVMNIPSSNPIIGGTINPYAEIDMEGNITKRDIDRQIDHVFDLV